MIYLYDGTETDFSYNGQPLPKARSTVVDYLINDEFYVTFQYPLDEDNVYKQIEKDKIITAHTPEGMQPFRIIDPAKHTNYIEVEAWPLFYADMRNKLVRPLTLRNATGHTAIAQFLNNLLLDTPFQITTNISDTHDYHTQDETERENNPNQLYDALEVFKSIVNRWNGEVIINGYDIRVVSRVGSNKEALLYEEKNIAEFVDKESLANLVTRLHGKAQWTEDDDDGEQIERSIQTTVDSPLINAYSGIIFEKQYTNNDIRTERELKNWLNLMFTTDNVDKPKRNIEVGTNVVDGQEIHAGDGLVLKYMKHDVDMEIRMVGYQYDGFANRYINIYLGDAKEKVTGSFKNSISNVENNISNNMQQMSHTIINSMGQKLIYSETEPKGNFKEGDTWFDNEGGMFFWDEEKADWIPHPYNRRTDIAEQLIKEAQQDLEETKENIDNRLTDLNDDIADKFTDLDVEILAIETISNAAQLSASTALDNSQAALNDASVAMDRSLTAIDKADGAISSISNINVEIDEINGTLDLKADSQTVNALDGTVSNLSTEVGVIAGELSAKADSSLVDTISGIVDNHTLDIKANAEGLALKADQTEVDTLEGTVSSLGTEFDAVAGKVSSKVWMSDIDDIEVGGRNYAFNTNDNFHPLRISGYSGTINQGLIITTEYKYSMDDLSAKIGDKITVSLYIRDTEYDLGGYLRIDIPGRPHKYSNRTIVKDGYISSTFTIDEETFNAGAILIYVGSSQHGTTYFVDVKEFQIEKGNKATDWSPAPEDTDAKIDYVESEMIQKYDSITSTVSSIDGRVSSQEQRVDSITTTIQEVTESVNGNTTLINQTKSTVDTHTQTIATIESDLEGKATVAQYNTLVSTVEGSIQRIGNAEGDITQIEANISGLQTTVAGKASQTDVTQLSNLYSVVVSDLTDLETDTEAQFSVMLEQINLRVTSNQLDTAISDSLSTAEAYADSTAQTAQEAAQEYAELKAEAERELAEVYAGGLISAEQQERITAIENNLSEAQSYAETKANEAKTAADEYTDIVAKDKVDIGKVVSQINIETDNILIESGKLLLDTDTVAFTGSAFIPSAAIESLTADKINTGELNGANVRIVNLDFNTAVGNRTEFVQSAWNNAVGGNVSISGSGIVTTASNGAQGLVQNGVFLTRDPSGSALGYIGYGQPGSDNRPFYTINLSQGAHFRTRHHLGSENYRHGLLINAGAEYAEFNVNRVHYKNQISLRHSGHFIEPTTYDKLTINGSSSVTLGASLQTVFVISASNGTGYSSLYANLDMKGYHIKNAGSYGTRSERKYKSNIIPIDNAIETVEQMNFYSYIKDGENELGIIADEAPESVLDTDRKTVNIYSYASLIGKSNQELIQRVKELESEVAVLKGMIA